MIDFASYNPAFLAAFGESFVLTRSEDLEDAIPATESITAIKCNPSMQEDVAPGDGSNYLLLWVDVNQTPPYDSMFGNGLITRYAASDIRAVPGALAKIFVPIGVDIASRGIVRSIKYFNQNTLGSGIYLSADNIFHAYILHLVSANNLEVVWSSGEITIPETIDPVGVIETISVSDVTVYPGDMIGFYGQGIPFDSDIGEDVQYYPATVLPVLGSLIKVGGSTYPIRVINRMYSMAASIYYGLPKQGDEIATESTIYKVVETRSDGTGGLYLKCRHDRAV
jgi:hypothetical protein